MTDEKKLYWDGLENRLSRHYFYLLRGVGILNEFRNLGFIVIGALISFKLTNPLWIVAILIPSLVILNLAGWYSVHRLGKKVEYYNVHFSTHYALLGFDLTKELIDEVRQANGKEPKYTKPHKGDSDE